LKVAKKEESSDQGVEKKEKGGLHLKKREAMARGMYWLMGGTSLS